MRKNLSQYSITANSVLAYDYDRIAAEIPLMPSGNQCLIRDPQRDLYPDYIRTYAENAVYLNGKPLNASHISIGSFQAIVSQGPHRNNQLDTVNSFFKMVYNERCDAIITVTDPVDPVTGEYKCFDYMIDIKKSNNECIEIAAIDPSSFTKDIPPQKVTLVYYQHWMDRDRPQSKKSFKALLAHCLRYKKPVIHCGAGVGRAGTCAALLSLYKNITENSPKEINMAEWIYDLRCQRGALVRRPIQIQFCFEMALELIRDMRYVG